MHTVKKLLLVLLSSFLFYFSFPNVFFNCGLGPVIFIFYIPFFLVVKESDISNAFWWGSIFGVTSFGLLGIWLIRYSLFCYLMILFLFAILCGLLSVVLKFVFNLFKNDSWIPLPFILTSFDYLRSLGPVGFSYGGAGYALAFFPKLIRISSFTGIFGVTFFIYSVQAVLFGWILNVENRKSIQEFETGSSMKSGYISLNFHQKIHEMRKTLKTHRLIGASSILFVFFILNIVLPFKEINKGELKRILLVQTNQDPWSSGIAAYTADAKDLIYLSREALEDSDCDLVVWPETAIVPSVIDTYYESSDSGRLAIVKNVLQYIESTGVPFVIGNFHREKDENKNFHDYNTALYFTPGFNVYPPAPEKYAKIHLVPFSESIPFKEKMEGVLNFLGVETNLWDKGTDYTLFNFKNSDYSFSTPICFEDTFSSPCREFALRGSDLFITLLNDSWSGSVAAQKQHQQMAIVRSVENRLPSVRCSVSGQTCYIDINGRIVKEAASFVKTWLFCDVELKNSSEKMTFYTLHGDLFARIILCVLFLLLIIKSIIVIIRNIKEK